MAWIMLYRVLPLLSSIVSLVLIIYIFFFLKRRKIDFLYLKFSSKRIKINLLAILSINLLYIFCAIFWLDSQTGEQLSQTQDLLWSIVESGYWIFIIAYLISFRIQIALTNSPETINIALQKNKIDKSKNYELVNKILDDNKKFLWLLITIVALLVWTSLMILVLSGKTSSLKELITLIINVSRVK
jgi:hypothetical protein